MALVEIHNYYESLVEQYIRALELDRTRDSDYLADLYCLVLNQLPAHYIRHNVDMIYFTSDEKRQEMEEKVIYAVSSAISWLDNEANRRSKREEL
jgi:Late competence development protein ComFB.